MLKVHPNLDLRTRTCWRCRLDMARCSPAFWHMEVVPALTLRLMASPGWFLNHDCWADPPRSMMVHVSSMIFDAWTKARVGSCGVLLHFVSLCFFKAFPNSCFLLPSKLWWPLIGLSDCFGLFLSKLRVKLSRIKCRVQGCFEVGTAHFLTDNWMLFPYLLNSKQKNESFCFGSLNNHGSMRPALNGNSLALLINTYSPLPQSTAKAPNSANSTMSSPSFFLHQTLAPAAGSTEPWAGSTTTNDKQRQPTTRTGGPKEYQRTWGICRGNPEAAGDKASLWAVLICPDANASKHILRIITDIDGYRL